MLANYDDITPFQDSIMTRNQKDNQNQKFLCRPIMTKKMIQENIEIIQERKIR